MTLTLLINYIQITYDRILCYVLTFDGVISEDLLTEKMFSLTLFRMGLFVVAHGWGQKAPPPLPEICYTDSAIVKLGTLIPP